MHPLETYLSALYDARLGGGVAETSSYAALANLLNEVGGGLKPGRPLKIEALAARTRWPRDASSSVAPVALLRAFPASLPPVCPSRPDGEASFFNRPPNALHSSPP